MENDILVNLKKITRIMEDYIHQYPAEYMWFYKIWKYSNQRDILILSDGKTGHLRQAQSVAVSVRKALTERQMESRIRTLSIPFKSKTHYRIFSLGTSIIPSFMYQRRVGFIKFFLDEKSFQEIMSVKADYIISCGASVASINHILSKDHKAKSIVILKPGLLNYKKFDLVVLPQHDFTHNLEGKNGIVVTHGAPNLITEKYLEQQSQLLLKRYPHLNHNQRFKIGLFIGGNSKNFILSTLQIQRLIQNLKKLTDNHLVDILATTSRRTPESIDNLLHKEFKHHLQCPLLISAHQSNVPEAVGGIMGLADVMIVSGESISMIAEAASSGKTTIVFPPAERKDWRPWPNKHEIYIDTLKQQGFIFVSDVNDIFQVVDNIMNKNLPTKCLDDNPIILEGLRKII